MRRIIRRPCSTEIGPNRPALPRIHSEFTGHLDVCVAQVEAVPCFKPRLQLRGDAFHVASIVFVGQIMTATHVGQRSRPAAAGSAQRWRRSACAGLLCDVLHFVCIVTTRSCRWQRLSVLMINSDCFQEFCLIFWRQMNLLLGLLRQDGNRLTFSQIKAFNDNFAAHYGSSGYLHARIILRCGKIRRSDTQRSR